MLKNKYIDEILFFLILMFPISTQLQKLKAFSYVNKIFIAVIIILLLFKIITKNINIPKIVVLSLTVILYVFSIIFTNVKLQNTNDLFYFGFWILFFIYMIENNANFIEVLEKRIPIVIGTIIVWSLIVLISTFFLNSFVLVGGVKNFQSFSNGVHRFASTCIFVLIMNLIVCQRTKKIFYLIFFIVPYFAIFFSGARTYLVILLILGISAIYCICNTKKKFIVFTIVFVIVSSCLIFVTPMGAKFAWAKNLRIKESNYISKEETIITEDIEESILSENTTSQKESEGKIFMNSITSGRTVFWKADIKGYLRLNFFKKLVGNGYNYVYDINEKAIHDRIWAHNDIINILLSNGFIGLILYFYTLIKYSFVFCKKRKISILLIISFLAIYFINAMLNMVYTYMCCVLMIPFTLYAFSLKES